MMSVGAGFMAGMRLRRSGETADRHLRPCASLPDRPVASKAVYWPELDGLRALGVIAVAAYHFDPALAPNGYIGVDLFFVLSGFLITTLMLKELKDTGCVSISSFYRRRAVRLIPALVLLCVAVVAAAPFSDSPRAVVEGALATALYAANWWIYSGHDTVLLQHAWTLSIEEQFYLVWPWLFVLVVRHRWVRYLVAGAIVALWVVSAGAELSGTVGSVVAGSYFRSFGLAVGCAAAFAPKLLRRVPGWVGDISVLALVGGVVASANHELGTSVLPAVIALPAVTAASVGPSGLLGSILRSRVSRWIGVRSYSLYLWHFPIGSLLTNHSPAAVPAAARLLLSTLCSAAVADVSYRLVEQPLRVRYGARLARGREGDVAIPNA